MLMIWSITKWFICVCVAVSLSQSNRALIQCCVSQEGLGPFHQGAAKEHRDVEETVDGTYPSNQILQPLTHRHPNSSPVSSRINV